MTTYTPEPGHERFIADLVPNMDPNDITSLVFSLSTYQIFDEEAPTAVMAYAASHLGLIMWNLQPGQENDYHVHPATEHLHIVVEGEVEYTLGDRPPVMLKAGDAAMVPAGVPHGIRNLSDKPASYFAIASMKSGPYEKVLVERP